LQWLSALAKNPKSLALGNQRMAERSQRTGVNKERINFKREEQFCRVHRKKCARGCSVPYIQITGKIIQEEAPVPPESYKI